MACDLLLAAFSKQIHSKTRVHTQGLSPSLPQINPSQNTYSNSGTVPEFSVPEFSARTNLGTVPEFSIILSPRKT